MDRTIIQTALTQIFAANTGTKRPYREPTHEQSEKAKRLNPYKEKAHRDMGEDYSKEVWE